MFEVGHVIGGKYRVEGTIATGGMGIVLRATHLHLREHVAIKILRPDTQARPESVARFMREARTTMKLRGAHVVRVFDVDLIDGRQPCIVMELLDGEDLALRIANGGPIAPAVAVDWLLQLCDGVAEAHAIGIVHRDLKPANVFVTRDGVVKVLDFGVSKASAALFDESAVTASSSEPRIAVAAEAPSSDETVDLTSTRTTLGSPRYMSPEQMRCARDVDERSDIWAIGAIAHEILSGDPPFEGSDLEALREAISRDTPKALAVPHALRAVVERCLAKDPSERFGDVGELARALRGPDAPRRMRAAAPFVLGGVAIIAAAAFVVSRPHARQPALEFHEPVRQAEAPLQATSAPAVEPPPRIEQPAPSSLAPSAQRRAPAAKPAQSAKPPDEHVFDNPE